MWLLKTPVIHKICQYCQMQKTPKSYQALEFLPLVKFISMNLAKNCQILDSSRAQIKAFQPCFGGSPGKLGSVLKTRVIILHSWTLFSSSKAFKHNQFQHWKLTIFQLVSFEKCKQTDRGHPVMSHVFWPLWPLGDTWYNHLGWASSLGFIYFELKIWPGSSSPSPGACAIKDYGSVITGKKSRFAWCDIIKLRFMRSQSNQICS